MALPALPPLLTSPTWMAPPLADAVETPPLPELEVSVCSNRASSSCTDMLEKWCLLLLWLLLLLLLLLWWLLFRPLPLPPLLSARLPEPPLESVIAVPPSATRSRVVVLVLVPPLTATQLALPLLPPP